MDVEEVILNEAKLDRVVKIRAGLPVIIKSQLKAFLHEYKDVFAWSHEDMPETDPNIIVQLLNVDL